MNTRSKTIRWNTLLRWLVLGLVLANMVLATGTPAAAQGVPTLHVVPAHPEVHGHDWPETATVTLTIEYPAGVALYTASKLASDNRWCGMPCFDLQGEHVFQSGQIVTMSDGTTTKTVNVTSLQVTVVDPTSNTVWGTADALTDVQVDIHDEGGVSRNVTADTSGNWVADFSVVGNEDHEQNTWDLRPGSSGRAIQFEVEGYDDGTLAYWSVPNPRFSVRPEEDRVEGWEWQPNATINLNINGSGYSTTSDGGGNFYLDVPVDIQVGHSVTVNDGVTNKDHTVTTVNVTSVNPSTDTVNGTAVPDSKVWTWIHGVDGSELAVTAVGGAWSRDFSAYGLTLGTGGPAVQYDDDGDATWIEWSVPNPRIEARPVDNMIQGWEWPEGPVDLIIDIDADPANGIIFEDSSTAYVPQWDPGTTYVQFDLQEVLDLHDGHFVTLSGGGFTKIHQVTSLNVTGVNPETDTVSGTAADGSKVWTWIHEVGGSELEVAVVDGAWTRVFSEGSLTPGTGGPAVQYDDDDDATWIEWTVPAPHLQVQKSADGGPGVDGNFAFHIDYWNNGDASAEDVTLVETMDGMTYLGDTSGLVPSGSGNGPIEWYLGTLPAHSQGSFDLFVQVTGAEGDLIENQVQISTSTPGDQGDPSEKESTWSSAVAPNDTHLNVGKNSWTGDPAPGTNFVYSVNVCNNGSTGSSEVMLTDTLHPAATTLLSWWSQHPGWTEVDRSDSHLVVTRPSIPGHWCSEVYLRVHVDASTQIGTYISNTAIIAASNDLESDDNETFWEGYVGEPHTNLYLSKDWLGGQLVAGGNLTYELRYGNDGNVPVDSVQIIDTLPANTSLQEIWRFDRNWNRIGQVVPTVETLTTVEWEVGAVENGDWGYFAVVLRVDETAAPGDLLVHTLEISPQPDEDDYEDNTITWTSTVNPDGPNLQVHKQNFGWNGDSQLWYEIRVKNFGTVRLEDIQITDTYPLDTTWNGDWHVGHGPWTEPTHDASARQLVFRIDSLDPGETASADYRVDLDESVRGLGGLYFTNIVEALWPGDVYPDDNSDTVVAYSGDLKWFVRVNQSHNWIEGATEPGSSIVATVWRDGLPIMADRTETGDGTWWQIDFCCDDERRLQIGDVVEVESSLGLFASVEIIPINGMVDANSDSVSGDISGVGTPADVLVEVWQEDGGSQEGQTDSSGHFDFEFTGYDILPGNMVFIAYVQPDGHQVGIIRHALRLDIDTSGDWVSGNTAPDTEVTVQLNGGEEQTAISDGEGQFEVYFTGDIAAGDTIEAWAGEQYVNHLLIESVTAYIDDATDTVHGQAPPAVGESNNINVGVEHDWRPARTDASGNFEVPYDWDITPDHRLDVEYSYPEGHQARYRFGPPDPWVNKWMAHYNYLPGDEFTFTIQYGNDGGQATGVQITDQLPEGLTYVSDTSGVTPIYDEGARTLTWALSTLGAGADRTFELQVTSAADTPPGQYRNTVEISADADRESGNNVSQTDVRLWDQEAADHWVDMELLSGVSLAGETLTYRLRYGNQGSGAATGVVLTDFLPANVTYLGSTFEAGVDGESEALVDGTVVWTIGDMERGAQREFEFSVRIDEGVAANTFLTNRVEISPDPPGWGEPRDNWRAISTMVEAPAADLWVDKVIEGDLSSMDNEILYRITFRNDGNVPAEDVILSDILPSQMVHVWNSAGSAITEADGTVIWSLGAVPPGAGGQVLLSARLGEAVPDGTIMTNVVEGVTSTDDGDPANNRAEVDLGPPLAITVPWAGADPHRVWSGLETTLKGVARGYGLTEYEWAFGDGSPPVSGWINDPYAIEAGHVYEGAVGQSFVATLTVRGAYGWSHSDTYTVQIFDRIHGVEKDVAIDEGLWYQHKAAQRYRSGGLPFTVWQEDGNPVAVNSSVIQAFQVQGHGPGGDPLEDPYVEDVQSGLNALLASAVLNPVAVQPAGDPDGDGDGVGIGMYEDYGHAIYESGLALMALASTGTEDRVARTGPARYVRGQTYQDIVQDMVDWFAWGQNDVDPDGPTDWARGGWRYQPNSGDSDNSNTQFPVLGLVAAEENLGIAVPQFVKDELRDYWLANTQNLFDTQNEEDGGFGYSDPWGMVNVGKTGAGIMDLVWAEVPLDDDRVERAKDYVERHYLDPMDQVNYGGNVGDFYAMYAVKKGSQLADIINYGPYLWDYAYSAYLVGVQQPDGRFDEDRNLGQWFGSWQPMSTAWALLILSPGLYEALPVAIISPYQANGATEWYEGKVQFDGTLSYHTDPGHSLVAYDWDLGDGGTAMGVTPYHQYCDDGDYVVTLTVTDDQAKTDTDSLRFAVLNLPPVIESISGPAEPVSISSLPVQLSASFSDPGACDTHYALWNWGDSTTTEQEDVTSPAKAFHTYEEPGVYEVTLTITDDDGDSDTEVYQYVVIYDPDGGFVTGGGWITSPAGAYTPDPTLSGKATFGFVSKYKKGATIPTGQTEFQFQVAGMNFHSDAYQWLVVTKSKAQYKGTGTINGEGNYGFMLTAIDASLTPSTNVDLFRIKIWDKDDGDTIIYDNQIGDSDDSEPTTAISGGSIVIHKAK